MLSRAAKYIFSPFCRWRNWKQGKLNELPETITPKDSSHKRLRLRRYQQATIILPKVAEFAIFLIVYFLRYTNPAVLKCNIKSHIRQLLIQQHYQLALSLWANNGCKFKWCSERSEDWKLRKIGLILPNIVPKTTINSKY